MIYLIEIGDKAKLGYTSDFESIISEYKSLYPDMKIETLDVDLEMNKIKENPEWIDKTAAKKVWKDLKDMYRDIQRHKH